MAKRKRTALPRVTVLAMSKRDLAAFVGAVEQLKLLVDDLRLQWEAAKRKKSGASAVKQNGSGKPVENVAPLAPM